MSIFIGGLAFELGGDGHGGADRLAILAASIVSAVAGFLLLRLSPVSEKTAAHTEIWLET
jgi:Na+/H+ antiporter NhaA